MDCCIDKKIINKNGLNLCISCGKIFDYDYITDYSDLYINNIYNLRYYKIKKEFLMLTYGKYINEIDINYAIYLFNIIPSILRRNNRKSIMISCVYLACRKNNNLKTIDELANIFKFDKKIIIKGLKKTIYDIKYNSKNVDIGYDNPKIYLKKNCDLLDLNDKQRYNIFKILDNIISLKILNNCKPASIAYIACYIMFKHIYNFNKLNIYHINKCTFTKMYNKIKMYENILKYDIKFEYKFSEEQLNLINKYKNKYHIKN